MVDNNQKKIFLNTVKIGDEIYIYLDRETYNKLNFPFFAVTRIEGKMQYGNDDQLYFDTSDSYDSYGGPEKLWTHHIQGGNSTIIEIQREWDTSSTIQDNQSGLYFFTKNSSTGVNKHVIPTGFLFKLEEIN